jgi:pyruvate ferredoxin oxidoreductase delta subunit
VTVPFEKVPFAGTVPSPQTENEGMITGNWRTRRPILDKEKCTDCQICWISCPDSCVNLSNNNSSLTFNLKYCKGCGICNEVCPVGAISLVPELDFQD